MPGLEDLTSDLEITSPQVNVEIDRDKAAALGVTANQIENAFYDAYGPRWVSTIYAPVNEYKVLLELAPRVPGGSDGAVAALLQGDARRGDQRAARSVAPLDTLGGTHVDGSTGSVPQTRSTLRYRPQTVNPRPAPR